MRHFLDLTDWNNDRIRKLLKDAAKLKKAHARGRQKPVLQGKVLGLIFEKPSLRTRVSFEAAILELGGGSVFLSNNDASLGMRKHPGLCPHDQPVCRRRRAAHLRARQGRAVRRLLRLPSSTACPDHFHPCQALGDLLTIQEAFGKLDGQTVVFVGDGNNVARSLALACGKMGLPFVLSAPPGYGFDAAFKDLFQHNVPGAKLIEEPDARRAVAGADVIYTDVWASMGQEDEGPARQKAFAPYQVNAEMLALAPGGAKVMHCLPAHRGEEITDDVLDGPHSIAFHQAGNRMHAQKALLVWLLTGKDKANGRPNKRR
ncbi:MAG: ornithine carbamoyltransferase [Gemmataceae bacterium]